MKAIAGGVATLAIVALLALLPPRRAAAVGPYVTIAQYDAIRDCVTDQHWTYSVEDAVKQTLPKEWFDSDPAEALRAGASVIRQDYWYFMHHNDAYRFCDGVTAYPYDMRDSRMHFVEGAGGLNAARATDDTVTKGWEPYDGSAIADDMYLSYGDGIQIDTRRLSHSQTWKAMVGIGVYPPGEWAEGAPYRTGEDINVSTPLGTVCLYDCTADYDADGVTNYFDNCAFAANPGQENYDGDGWGDACDLDDDDDGCGDTFEPQFALNPDNQWDFYNVPVPALFAALDPLGTGKDSSVAAPDAQSVFGYYKKGAKTGTTVYEQDLNRNGIADGIEYDRSFVGPAMSGPPQGQVSAQAAQIAFKQYKKGYKC